MSWSFSVTVPTKAEGAAALKAEAERTNQVQYVPNLDKLCEAAEVLLAQLPDAPGKHFNIGTHGHVETTHGGANLSVTVVEPIAKDE